MRRKPAPKRVFSLQLSSCFRKSNDVSFILLRNSAEGLFYLATFIFIYCLSLVVSVLPEFPVVDEFTVFIKDSVNALTYMSLSLIVTFILSLRLWLELRNCGTSNEWNEPGNNVRCSTSNQKHLLPINSIDQLVSWLWVVISWIVYNNQAHGIVSCTYH